MLAELAKLGADIGAGIFNYDQAEDATGRAQWAAGQASKEQEDMLRAGIDERRSGNDQVLALLKSYLDPYATSGASSNKLLSDALGVNGPEAQRAYFAGFQNDPGFMATQKAGTDAIEQSASGGGLLRSGGTLKGLMDYGQQGMFAQISDRLNRLSGLGTQGQQAASTIGTTGANSITSMSSAIANYLKDIGTARAGGIINASNADQAGTQNLMSIVGNTAGKVGSGISDLIGQFASMGA